MWLLIFCLRLHLVVSHIHARAGVEEEDGGGGSRVSFVEVVVASPAALKTRRSFCRFSGQAVVTATNDRQEKKGEATVVGQGSVGVVARYPWAHLTNVTCMSALCHVGKCRTCWSFIHQDLVSQLDSVQRSVVLTCVCTLWSVFNLGRKSVALGWADDNLVS